MSESMQLQVSHQLCTQSLIVPYISFRNRLWLLSDFLKRIRAHNISMEQYNFDVLHHIAINTNHKRFFSTHSRKLLRNEYLH